LAGKLAIDTRAHVMNRHRLYTAVIAHISWLLSLRRRRVHSLLMACLRWAIRVPPLKYTGDENVPKVIINGTINLFLFLKLQSTFWYFQTITVSECCLIKLLPYKYYLFFSIGNGQLRERALCQLYRHTFVSY